MFAHISGKKYDELVAIFGKDETDKLVTFAETKSRELERLGVDLKSLPSGRHDQPAPGSKSIFDYIAEAAKRK